MLFPRFRSKERDLRVDLERFSLIEATIIRAIDEAQMELAGLSNRLDEARSRAAFLYGDVIDSEEAIDSRSTALIEEAERFLIRGEKRRGELADHLALLGAMKQQTSKAINDIRNDIGED